MNHLKGNDIGLSAIAEVGIVQSQTAQRITWHSHPGWQLIFLLGGATSYEFRQTDVKHIDLSGEHFVVIPSGIIHRGVQDMRPPCELLHLIVAEDEKGQQRNTPFSAAEWQWLNEQFKSATIAAHPTSLVLRRAVTLLAREVQAFSQRRRAPLSHVRLRARICEVLIEAAEQLTKTSLGTTDTVVIAAERFLRQHFQDSVRMSAVAEKLGISRARLFDVFKRGTGMTPNDYLLRVRIEKAKALLGQPALNVTDIAFDSGFASSQYFSTVFRKYTGQTPMEFRQTRQRSK